MLLQPRGHLWHQYLSPKTAEPFCMAPSVQTGPHAGEISPAHISPPSPRGQLTHGAPAPHRFPDRCLTRPEVFCQEKGVTPQVLKRGEAKCHFVTILHSNSKSFHSVLTSNLVWAILPVWDSQAALISPCGWGFLGGGGLF